ncbi:GTP-binding protein Rho1, partial [Ceratobasidium sp. 392]
MSSIHGGIISNTDGLELTGTDKPSEAAVCGLGPGDKYSRVEASQAAPLNESKLESSLVNGSKVHRKLAIAGGGACGKTCLLLVLAKGIFQEEDIPTICDDYVANVEVDGISVELALPDTSGLEEYSSLRPLSYQGSHVVLMCFSIDSRNSFESIEAKWVSEVNHFCPGLPFILVGCKKDLRHNATTIEKLRLSGQILITTEEGMELAQKIGARRYLECSSQTGEGVDEVFQWAVRIALTSRPNVVPGLEKQKKSKSD